MSDQLQNTREDYSQGSLSKKDVQQHPVDQFSKWFAEYESLKVKDLNAMVLSTVGENNKPSSRVVLLKGFDKRGFEFYTNYRSHKALDIIVNNQVSLVFFWPEMERQIRVEGKAVKLSKHESDAYFKERPRGSQIGAWTSPQSEVIRDRTILEDRLSEMEKKFEGVVERPEDWGGYCIIPDTIEFWQGRSNRLHDRIKYVSINGGDQWDINRLAP